MACVGIERDVADNPNVQSLLSNRAGERAFTRTLVTSGSAPLSPGSRAAVAAVLSPEGATLLWDSLKGATSDVSVGIRAYYEAQVEAYNAKVTADVEAIYTHFSSVRYQANGYTRRDIRNIADELRTRQMINVEVFDRSVGLNVKDEFMPAFLANDILRLWRTFCVNYEARTQTEPAEKKAKRKPHTST